MNFKEKFLKLREKNRRAASALTKVIELAVVLFVLAFILPPALTAVATSALTSVNGAVVTLFQVLTPIIAIVAVILLIYGAYKSRGFHE